MKAECEIIPAWESRVARFDYNGQIPRASKGGTSNRFSLPRFFVIGCFSINFLKTLWEAKGTDNNNNQKTNIYHHSDNHALLGGNGIYIISSVGFVHVLAVQGHGNHTSRRED